MKHTDTKKPTGSLNSTVGDTDTSTVANAQATDKAFPSLRAAFALKGHRLRRSAEPEREETFWAESWGMVRYLPTLHDAALFLAQMR